MAQLITITGNIATGKSYITNILHAEYGFSVINADYIGHALLNDEEIKKELISAFGSLIAPLNVVDRKILGNIVFNDKNALQILNKIVHPLLFSSAETLINNNLKNNINTVFEAAIIFEAGLEKRFKPLILTVCHPEEQLKRLVERNNFSKSEALSIINAQIPQEKKLQHADFVIDTTFGLLSFRKNLLLIVENIMNQKQVEI